MYVRTMLQENVQKGLVTQLVIVSAIVILVVAVIATTAGVVSGTQSTSQESQKSGLSITLNTLDELYVGSTIARQWLEELTSISKLL